MWRKEIVKLSSDQFYGYGQEPSKLSRAELAELAKKKMELQNTGGWRDGTTKIFDSDKIFKMVNKHRQEHNDNVKSTSNIDSEDKGGYTRAYYEQREGRLPINGIELIIASDDLERANAHNDKLIAEYYANQKKSNRGNSQ